MKRIYLDNAATTPLNPEAARAMYEWNLNYFGNPSSVHHFGQIARARLEEARDVVAEFLGVPSKNLFFTSGATEGNNWILKSVAHQFKNKRLLVSQLEHPSVFKTAKYLQANGYQIDFIEPDEKGRITVEQIEKVLQPETALISVMYVNNETGIIHPVQEIGRFCADRGIKFHCDAVQAFAKLQFTADEIFADYLTISAHKIHGPKGVGAVYLKEPALLEPYLHGGEQEAGKRAGTENLAGIIGFAETLKQQSVQSFDSKKVKQLQSFFESNIKKHFPQAVIIGEYEDRSPFISQIAFPGQDNQRLLMLLDLNGVAVSVGSACSSGSLKPSPVLQKMHLPEQVVNSAIRFSFSYLTEILELQKTLEIIKKLIN